MTNQLKKITLELPEFVDVQEAKLMIFASLFGKGVISSGKAASLLDVSRIEFLHSVGNYGISVFSDDESNLENALTIKL